MDFQTIARLRKYLSVKHSIPGRIRIKFDKAIISDPEALKLAQGAPEMPEAVTNTDLNVFSGTLLIEYDYLRVPPTLLEELISAENDQRAAEVVKELHSVLYH